MNVIEKVMLNNTIKSAQFKLQQHRALGKDSKLNILEVAQLMDSIRNAEQIKNSKHVHSIFYNISFN